MSINKVLICGMFLSGCTPQEVFIAEEVFHEASVAEEAIEKDLMGPGAPEFSRPKIDDRTAAAKPLHDDVTKAKGRKTKKF